MYQRDKAKKVFAYYWKHLTHYPRLLSGVAIVLPITVLVNAYLPTLVLANVLSKLSKHNYYEHQIWSSFGSQLLIYIGLLFFGMLLWRLTDYFAWKLEGNIERDIAEEVLDHMLDESADFHANNFSGSLVSKTNKLMGGYIRAADTSLFQVYPLAAGIIITAVILFSRAPIYVLLLATFSVLFIALAFRIARPVQRMGAKMAQAESQQTGYLADAISNVIAIKSFSRGGYERQRFHKATSKTFGLLNDFSKVHMRQMNYLGTLSRSMGGLALLAAVVSVMVFNIDIATVFLIFSYTAGIVDQLFGFSNTSLRHYNRVIGDTAEMIETLAQKPSVQDPLNPEMPRMSQGRVEFKNVSFDHESSADNQTEKLFNNFSLQIAPGEKIGLVGHSGGGKTTLTKLILRFMDIDSGQILIDDQNIAAITQDNLRRQITYVPQEPMLFHRTLRENISYGKDDATDKEVEQAAKMAHAHEFIIKLPHGYQTLVGERGIKLSGGQRQRVAIARAMLKDAPIVVLDEATSALDSESEKLIQDALWKLMERKTVIAIAHRLSTIQKMNRILVMEEGQVVEQGSHKELLAHGGIYASLWAHQSGGFLDE